MAAPMDHEMFMLAADNNDHEMVLMCMLPRQSRSTYNPHTPKFELDLLSDDQCLSYFRFDKRNIRRLGDLLRFPDKIICENRTTCSGLDALCILLRRLSYPNRLLDLEVMFGRPKSTLSLVISAALNHIYDTWNHLLSDLNQPWIDFQIYSDVIHRKGAPLTNCLGFIDGTVRPICRPTANQRVCYNGHKRIHSIKFQSLVTPDGMITNLYGPLEGRRHDCGLLRMSGIMEKMEELNRHDRDGLPFSIYGDPAYPLRNYLLCPYRGANLTEQQMLFNQSMSSVRECVEWEFGKLLSLFAFLDFRKNLKVLLQPVAKYYIVGAILTNCHHCIYGSQTSKYFNLSPPTLENYLL